MFSIKDLGKLHFFLGIEVNHIPKGIILTQNKFTKDLITKCGFTDLKKVVTPVPMNIKLFAHNGIPLKDPTPYRYLVGKLNVLTNIRLDLAYSVQI